MPGFRRIILLFNLRQRFPDRILHRLFLIRIVNLEFRNYCLILRTALSLPSGRTDRKKWPYMGTAATATRLWRRRTRFMDLISTRKNRTKNPPAWHKSDGFPDILTCYSFLSNCCRNKMKYAKLPVPLLSVRRKQHLLYMHLLRSHLQMPA